MHKDFTIEYFRILIAQNLTTYVKWLTDAQGKEQLFVRDAMIAMGED
jgi:hypothetical protein